MEDKDDVNLPKATLSKMIRDHLPSTMRVSADVVDLIIESCTEFIHLVSAEANEMCNKGEKRTIAPEHVIQALTVRSQPHASLFPPPCAPPRVPLGAQADPRGRSSGSHSTLKRSTLSWPPTRRPRGRSSSSARRARKSPI
mmetsp:Transcript_30093/g.96434  ORF Transcript_30093/g.96434 Transcript_30093/m.96434 type:complete len:141 (+) Transcript_30093:201-623(+)